MTTPAPEPFSLPVVKCPACGHGIDPHGTDPGGPCGVGDEQGKECSCLWSPNDIAGSMAGELCNAIRLTVEYVGTKTLPPIEGWSWYDALSKHAPETAAQLRSWHERVHQRAKGSKP